MGERFIVRETRGYAIGPQGRRAGSREASSFAVLDTAICHREVAPGRFYARQGVGRWPKTRRRDVEAFAAELNEWDRETRCA